ncbi:reductase [Amycolatopsis antarctica]|uniref:Reductase n=1 Tax=Amycolatopsis antarctica TaxID=1854586 RepID=A0A263CZJ8_9PSEU|nr:dihydrofolate reductase family protein [Amycolatopsis antarctica]OZM71308.1 reductase [Amycolatopsis antarctica]
MTPGSTSRRLVAQQWISLDGYAAGPDGEERIFAAVPDFSPGEKHNRDLLAEVDLVLLGRRTYESFVRFWPTAAEPMAELVNTTPKVVCSTTLDTAPWGRFAPAEVVADAVGHVRALRAGPGKDILLWGSLALMRSLLRARLVDELDLFVAPVLLGGGTPLVAPEGPYDLTQLGGDIWNGSTHVRYAVGYRRDPD